MKRRTFREKQQWVLDWLDNAWEANKRSYTPPMAPSITSADEDTEEAWHAEFGGQRVYYTLGPNVSPDLSRTLRSMYDNGILYRGTNGTQEARGYRQKTYYVWYILKSHYHQAKTMQEEYRGATA